MFNYNDFTLRNAGYISTDLQDRLRRVSLLIAGCGVGSVFAEVAVRLGCENIILADGDTIAPHNLNRQNFINEDSGHLKVPMLAKRLRAINPQLKINELPIYLNTQNMAEIVAQADVVFDTVDFMDLPAIIALHDTAKQQRKAVFSGANSGFGAALFYFSVNGTYSYRDIFNLPATGAVDGYSYTDRFSCMIHKARHFLPNEVQSAVNAGLTKMADGMPCPMSQVAIGAHCLGGLAATALIRWLANLPIVAVPRVMYMDMAMLCATSEVAFRE